MLISKGFKVGDIVRTHPRWTGVFSFVGKVVHIDNFGRVTIKSIPLLPWEDERFGCRWPKEKVCFDAHDLIPFVDIEADPHAELS